MISLIKKEINGFLNSLIGYLAIIVFLLTISLLTWVFPDSSFNIPDAGYATIEPLFILTPWVYMFLVPAITMRLFSEERKTGTIELLLTRPLTEMQVVLAKYISGVALVLFSLLPTLVYYYSVHSLGAPAGNIDTGSMWGSYIGLFLLGAVFVSIGVFASALTDNQVIAFIIGLFLCLICYTGFDAVSGMLGNSGLASIIYNLGLSAHYASMSRGVIDTRDVVYFASVITFFIMTTRTILESRKW
jgi:ABC-2 type transport system permease protein